MFPSSFRAGIRTDTFTVLPFRGDRQLSRIQAMLVTASTKKYSAAMTGRRTNASAAACSQNGVTDRSSDRANLPEIPANPQPFGRPAAAAT